MSKDKKAKHIKARSVKKNGLRMKSIVLCERCNKEEILEVDEKSMEGFMAQISNFTNKHFKCKGKL